MVQGFCALVVALVVTALSAVPVQGAERIVVRFSDGEYSLEVGEIEQFLLTEKNYPAPARGAQTKSPVSLCSATVLTPRDSYFQY
jgi:hypothetical protein